jgi:hypothetical protein
LHSKKKYYELLKFDYEIGNKYYINEAINNILNNEKIFNMNYFYILNCINYDDTEINMLKYNILRTTTIIPQKNIYVYFNEYITLVTLTKSILPKNIVNLIAGFLFI